MRAHDDVEDRRAVGMDRPDHRHVVEVRAAGIRIVVEQDVVRPDLAVDRERRGYGARDGNDVERMILTRFGDQAPLSVDQDAGEVVALVDDRGIGGLDHCPAHLAHDGAHGLPNDGAGRRIGTAGNVQPECRHRSIDLKSWIQ